MTPFEMKIALHYFCCCTDTPDLSCPAGPRTIREFVEKGLLTDNTITNEYGQRFFPTEKLRAYCEALEAVQLPIQKWVMPANAARL